MISIRLATDRDLPVLPAIESAAAAQFRLTPYPHMAEAPLASASIDLMRDLVWVATAANTVVAFVIVRVQEDAIHIHEIDVHPSVARRGIGAALIDAVADWARQQGIATMTVTTFDNVPWNAPYYERLGFALLLPIDWTDALRATRAAEREAGLPMEHRVCMRLNIPPASGAIIPF